jgi:hypothetical protein
VYDNPPEEFMSIFGVDYAWGRPGGAALKSAGAKFVCRYLSHDTSGKNLTRAEARQLSDAGIWIVVVWESGKSRALASRAAGQEDARAARKQAEDCGMPDDRPIFFAVDFDATSSQQSAINAYLDGVAAVLGRDRVGLYAGYGPIKRAFDAKKITWGWQTYAWSRGRWDNRAHIQQYLNDQKINGVGVDHDRAMTEDYGQWKVGESPMALSADDLDKIRRAVWHTDSAPRPELSDDIGGGDTWAYVNLLRETFTRTSKILQAVDSASPSGGQADKEAIVSGMLAGLSPKAIAAAVADALPAEQAAQVVDELKARLGN